MSAAGSGPSSLVGGPTVPPGKRLLRLGRAGLHLLAGLRTTTFAFPKATPARRRAMVRQWSRRLLRILGVRVRVQGRFPEHGNLLLVANHISWLDIFLILSQRHASFVAKAELAGWPFAGRLMRDVGTIFVERERRRDTRRVNDSASRALAAGDVVAVFPEGTTGEGSRVLRFHASLLQPIVDSQGEVVPLAIRYREGSIAPTPTPTYVGEDSFMASLWRICGARSLVAQLQVGEPLPARDTTRRALAGAAEAAIRAALDPPASATEPGTGAHRPAGRP